jgi:hypothetical protein
VASSAASAHKASSTGNLAPDSHASSANDDDMMRLTADAGPVGTEPEFDLSSTFDVPAFLRRQEG